MNEKPILFNTEMVKAILEGRKTVTRRVIKPPRGIDDVFGNMNKCKQPYQVGDILYVRETWRPTIGAMHTMSRDGKRIVYTSDEHVGYEYKAHCFGVSDFYFSDGFKESENYEHMSEIISHGNWHPSIHMPKEAARIWLKVTDVRVERLQDIFDDPPGPNNQIVREGFLFGCDFIAGWENTIKKTDRNSYGWDANPWVWVIEFEVIKNDE